MFYVQSYPIFLCGKDTKKDNDENLQKNKISSLRRVGWLDKPINFNTEHFFGLAVEFRGNECLVEVFISACGYYSIDREEENPVNFIYC